jgi:GT2 family glycosyltransferase
MARVAILIVTYNSDQEIGACLDALSGLPDVEILVVDNASEDSSRAEAARRGVRVLANSGNAGFAAAVNQGVRATEAPLVLLLNPDAHYVGGLDHLVAAFDDPRTGAAGGVLIGSDGAAQVGFMARNLPTPATLVFETLGLNRLWPDNPVNWHYRCRGIGQLTADSSPVMVDQPAGAFLMFSRPAWERLGGFDERFWPIWFEDVDFCARLKQAGYKIFLVPRASANHKGAHSIGALPSAAKERFWYGSLLDYAAKFFTPLEFRVVCGSVAVGSVLRAVLAWPGQGRGVWDVHGPVVRLAFARLRGRADGRAAHG